MKIVFPMAGRGSRFLATSDTNPEYKKPKPLIDVSGEPMIAWAVKSLPFVDLPTRPAKTSFAVSPKDLVFICLQEHEEKLSIIKELKRYFTDAISVVLIPAVTRGATETALAAKPYIASDEELIISDSDHYFDGEEYTLAIAQREEGYAGIIPVFKPPDRDPKWSYTLFDENRKVLAVGEKDVSLAQKGAYANIGAYYFSRGDTFVNEAEAMVRENAMYGSAGKQEFYLAPIYQRLIVKGMGIKAVIIDKVWGLGTPKDLEDFLVTYKPHKRSATSSGKSVQK